MAGFIKKLKSNDRFMMVYRKLRNIVFIPLCECCPVTLSKYRFKKVLHQKFDMQHVTTFNQRLMKLKLTNYMDNPKVIQCADKLRVRDYVSEKGCSEILIPLLGVYKTEKDIDWDLLPDRFALKCNHGCGYNIICTNKSELDKKKAARMLRYWMHLSCGAESAERHYMRIKRCIIAEPYISTDAGRFPRDYRFYCSYGEVKTCLIMHYDEEGYKEHKSFHIFVDTDYHVMDIANSIMEKDSLPAKPKCFDDMMKYASILSKEFPFVRVDLYDNNGKVMFGELTFTPVACMGKYNESKVLDALFGDIQK